MNSTNSIICPTCGTQVEISEALFRRAEGELRIRWEAEAKERLERATVVAREDERKKAQDQLGQLRQLLKQSATQLEGMQRRELELQRRAAEIDQRKSNLEAELQLKLSELVTAQEERIKAEAAKQTQLEMTDLKNQIAEQTTRLQEATTAELEHRKRVRDLENEKHEIDLTVQRKVDEERQRIETTARQMSAAEYELKLREKDQQNERLRQAVEELKRKSEQGSVELQGEALELDLEEKLRGAFPQDVFNPVARGARGADVLHIVRNSSLVECGTIIWEAKNSKTWSAAWIEKLKEDKRNSSASVAVLVTVAMPRDLTHFGLVEGICVCTPQSALPLAALLRDRLEDVYFAKGATQARVEKTELIFDYVSGDDFRHQVEAIIHAFDRMRHQLGRERKAMEKQWKERDKLLDVVMVNTARMYGDLRGIAGASIKEIPSLELDATAIDDVQQEDGLSLSDLRPLE